MISSNPINELSNEYCKYDIKCRKTATNHCQGCGKIYCMDHYLEHQKKLQEQFEYVIHIQYLFKQNLNSLISQLSRNNKLDSKKQIDQFKIKSSEIEKTINIIQKHLQDVTHEDKQELKNKSQSDNIDYLENDIQHLTKDIEELNSKIEEINQTEPSKHKEEEEEEMIGVIDSNTTSKVTHKVRLSHNYIRWIRGPAKVLINGMTHATGKYTQRKNISDAVVQAVKQGLIKQKQNTMEQQSNNNSLKPVFTEITSDWIFEGENADPGFISASIWVRDPQSRRILVKTQGHPLSAVNEWLAYALGKTLHLPVNEVQIAIYQNKLVSLHTDIAYENEKTITFMELPKQKRKTLLTYPIMESMDLFDHIIQNVDRTPRNILTTMPNATTVIDDTATLKIHLIDHSFCFDVGKHDFISPMSCKLHSKHFSVVKFDPIDEGRKFEQYLNKLPIADRTLISKTLNNFATITNDQFNSWMTEVHDLLSPSQYDRIHAVLHRQRDIATYYTRQWQIPSTPSSIKPN